MMPMFEAWHKKRPEPFMVILDEIDKFFPSRELKDSEAILSEYVKFFKVIRSLAQSYQCLTTLVVAYRPHINRHNLLTPSVGENPMFKSFQEEYLGFLSPKDTKSMIQEIGMWKDIVWDDDAAERVFYYCGGHPLVCRYFASMACKGGSLKHIDMERVEFVADDVVKTFRKNDIGNYYKEAVWALLTEHEHEVLAEICKKSDIITHTSEDHQDALINLERFGLVRTENNMSCLTANLFDSWLRGRLGI
ncbi:MAG: hypothetical protein HC887_08240 [Desulfobacteraceae bacterium]|nr:hypothetical protein [Desulfobacteraceae bacterium]